MSSFLLIGGLRHRQKSATCDARPFRLNLESNAVDLPPSVGNHVFLQCCIPFGDVVGEGVNA